MSNVINLRRYRKRKAREDAAAQAAQNRARFGRTPAQKRRDEQNVEDSRRRLDLLKREPPTDTEA